MSLDGTDASRRWCRWTLRNFDRRTFVMGAAAATGLTVVAAPLAFADTGDPSRRPGCLHCRDVDPPHGQGRHRRRGG